MLFAFTSVRAQLSLSVPHARVVYQRDLSNQARVPVAGLAPPGTTRVEARLIPMQPAQGSATNWQPIPLLPGGFAFRGTLVADGGCYQLQVRAKSSFTITAQTVVDRIGVGEVFIIAGQSNALGVFEESVDATDDRVSCIDSRQDDPAEQMLNLPFSRAGAKTNIGPSNPPYIWTMLGDSLTRRLNVPVLFLGAAQGGTSSTQWAQTASGNGSGGLSPYRRLGITLLHYAARTGVRAILWHQGESDNIDSTSRQTYVNNIRTVIEKARSQTGYAQLPWLMSRTSYISGTTRAAVIQAQNDLISTVPGVWPGPETDTSTSLTLRPDGLHFGGIPGLKQLTRLWNHALNESFFQSATPFQPDTSALITTGYVLPLTHRTGDTLSIPYVLDAPLLPGNQFRLQLANASGEVVLTKLLTGPEQNPIHLIVPGTLATGAYRVQIQTTQPALKSTWSEPFRIEAVAFSTALPPDASPFITGGQPDAGIQRIGYRYDQPTHGFDALVSATVPVEIRLQRLDKGAFPDTNWAVASPTDNYPSFTLLRNYPPLALGVGGVEPGRYRLSVRRLGDSGPGLWIEGTFLDKRHTVYIHEEPAAILAAQPDRADVTLHMQVDRRVLSVGDLVQYTLRLTNNGPDDATNIRLVNRLPDALRYVSSANTNLGAAAGIVSATVVGLQAGESQDFSFSARVTSAGRTTNAAEVAALDQIDPNSLPGSGTADGENDMATADFRTQDGSTANNISPNPGGRVLPPVASNQPPPDPTHVDLSLLTRLNNRVPAAGDTLKLTLQVTNTGGQSASAISLQTTLPIGWQVIPDSTVVLNGQLVTTSVAVLPPGQTGTRTISVRVGSAKGPFRLLSEVGQATGSDVDSAPGNGNLGRGEDDEATVDGRVR